MNEEEENIIDASEEPEGLEEADAEAYEDPEDGESSEQSPEHKASGKEPIELTAAEQHRLAEVLLYCYFNQMDEKVFGTAAFWNTVKGICETFGIDNIAISKGFRILMVDTNRPTDLETWYLLDKTQHSVRQIRSISGIYWQKQKRLLEEVQSVGTPAVRPRILDAVMRKHIKDFVFAVYSVCGIFQFTDAKTLQKALC